MRGKLALAPVLAAIFAIALVVPAAAGRPEKIVISFDDPVLEAEISALLTDACNAPITADLDGKVVVIVLDKPASQGAVEINAFEIRNSFTNTATGATAEIVDAGPDLYSIDPETGHLVVAITGRALTGSGVIGRVVIDLETGEVITVSGLAKGDWIENLCGELT